MQKEVLEKLDNQNDRQVLWVSDRQGNSGKTFMTKWLLARGNAIRFTNAKSSDIAYAYTGQDIVIFDISRTIEGYFNYGICEDLKNGMLFCGKYASKSKVFVKPPRIVIMANWLPDKSAMSSDRWDILEVPDGYNPIPESDLNEEKAHVLETEGLDIDEEVVNKKYVIHHIKATSDGYEVWIKKDDEIVCWKNFSISMPVSLEYKIDF